MGRHTTTNNSPSEIKIPLQSTTKTGRPIFAYLRRSTKKEEQRDSKQKQNDSIDLMAIDIGINLENIQIFEDDYTAFEITTKNGTPLSKRKGWNSMINEINKARDLCIILVYDVSRLGRNTPDGVKVCELLGGYGNKAKVEYIRFYDGTKWDKNTSENEINTAFVKACGYSEALSKQKTDKNITSLRRNIMPKTIKAPHGLKATDRGLMETDTMQYIYKAFEMKAEGTLGKVISKYLISHGIPVSEGNLAFMVFQKTQYIGEYTHPKTGDVFDKLKFVSGKTAIPSYLWDKVQTRLGKKVGGYGEKQQGDIIAGLLRWEDDKERDYSFTLDIKTKPNGKQHKYYKSNSFGGINIGERKIIEEFIKEVIPKIYHAYEAIYEIESQRTIERVLNKLDQIPNKKKRRKTKSSEEKFKQLLILMDKCTKERTTINFKKILQQSNAINNDLLENETKASTLKLLEHKKLLLEEEKKTIMKNALRGGYSLELANETVKDTEKDIQNIENQIDILGESTDMEQFINRLPEILNKTFELASKVLPNEDIKALKDDIGQLFEICTFELTINAKKELKVKLFDGLENFDNLMVGDIGFEPMTPCV